MKVQLALLFRLSFLLIFFTLLQAPLNAKRVYPGDRIGGVETHFSWGKAKKQKLRKRGPNPKKYKNGAGPIWPSVLLWYLLIPLGIIALFAAAFWTGLISLAFWYVALGLSAIWLGISGIVFFPIQYVGLPLGMAGVVFGLIFSNPLIMTAGIALLLASIIAFGSMALMFLLGTSKYQPKAK